MSWIKTSRLLWLWILLRISKTPGILLWNCLPHCWTPQKKKTTLPSMRLQSAHHRKSSLSQNKSEIHGKKLPRLKVFWKTILTGHLRIWFMKMREWNRNVLMWRNLMSIKIKKCRMINRIRERKARASRKSGSLINQESLTAFKLSLLTRKLVSIEGTISSNWPSI